METFDELGEKEIIAIKILKETDILKECSRCGELIQNSNNISSACSVGNSLFTHKDKQVSIFSKRREMTDKIKEVFDGASFTNDGELCESCNNEFIDKIEND